jgi:heat-inducible transcriptional repressor
MTESLSDRERRILDAVIQSYVETAEPVGSRTVARRFGLGVSAATIRNAMSDLEEKGFLYHPHTSAGRVPTDRAYRIYVDSLMRFPTVAAAVTERLREDLVAEGSAISAIIRRAAQALSILTQELGVAVEPSLDSVVLERLELLAVASDRLLMVLTLHSGAARTVFVQVAGTLHPEAVASIAQVLNERLAGLTLRDIRQSLPERVRDTATTPAENELLDIFVATGEQIFDLPSAASDAVVLGRTSLLAEQPEFASGPKMRELIELTEQREVLKRALESRANSIGLTVTIGGENENRSLSRLTLVTAPYHSGPLSGVIGVLGPTRMPYDKVVALVEHTSRLVGDLLR